MTNQGYGVAAAARNLGLNASLLGRWKREVEQTRHEAFPGNGRVSLDQEDVYRLREENRRLRMEREILKKALGFLASESK